MYIEPAFDRLSIWFVMVFIFVIIMVFIELGYLLGLRAFRRKHNEGYTAMSAGIASLLAFILALTFNMSAGRNDDRKQMVVDESNAIGTAYLRSDLLPKELADSSKKLLKHYTSLRASDASDPEHVNFIISESESTQKKLWSLAIKTNEQVSNYSGKLYIESINDVFDIHTLRVNRAIKGRIPEVIWGSLILLTCFAMMLSGLQNGAKNNPRMIGARIPFGLAFSIIFTLIIELDRPGRSLIDVDQSALTVLYKSMD